MDLGLKGKIAAVAASSKGLGRAVAEALAREGANLAINGRTKDALVEAVASIEELYGVTVSPVPMDLATQDGPENFISETVSRFGRLDVLVTNAGGPPPGTFTAITEDQWKAAFDLTLMSAIRMVRAALPHMRKNKWGRIVNITSITVKQPADRIVLSNAYRAAVTAAMKSLSNEVGPDNILINNVAPGCILTDRLKKLHPADSLDKVAAEIPLRRIGKPEEFANVVAFLCSERASYVTGTTVLVDGGAYRGL